MVRFNSVRSAGDGERVKSTRSCLSRPAASEQPKSGLLPRQSLALGQNVAWLTLRDVQPRVCVLLAQAWVLLAQACVPPAQPWVRLAQAWVLLAQACGAPARRPWVLLAQAWVRLAQPCVPPAQPWVPPAQPWVLLARSPYHCLSPRRPPRRRTRPVSPSQRPADCRGSRWRARRDYCARLAYAAAGPVRPGGGAHEWRPFRRQSVGLVPRRYRRCSSLDSR